MAAKRLLITGFGPFPGIERNPSREIAQALAQRGLGPGVQVDAAELPVVFSEVAGAIDAALARLSTPPDLLLGIGVWSKGTAFRLERRARGTFDELRQDNAGATGAGLDLGPERFTQWDLAHLARRMEAAGAGTVLISEDAGRYVCERTYFHLLTRAGELNARALFVHVPPLDVIDLELQIAVVGALAAELVA